MSKDLIDIYVTQGDLYLALSVEKEVVDKRAEIAKRYPEGTFSERGLDLLKMARKELEQGKELFSPELDKSQEQ
jgi:hypothetical protein